MSLFHVTPHQMASVRLRFGKIISDEPWLPGFHWKSPLTTVYDMYTGFDKDEVSYTCGTNDGVRFQGTVVVTNQIPPENVVESYRHYGRAPDVRSLLRARTDLYF